MESIKEWVIIIAIITACFAVEYSRPGMIVVERCVCDVCIGGY